MEIDYSILKDTAICLIGLSSGGLLWTFIDYLSRKRNERKETQR